VEITGLYRLNYVKNLLSHQSKQLWLSLASKSSFQVVKLFFYRHVTELNSMPLMANDADHLHRMN
jgi:hypothetical protein